MRRLLALPVMSMLFIALSAVSFAGPNAISVAISSNASAQYTDVFNVTDDVYAQYWMTLECPEAYPAPFWVDVYIMPDKDNWMPGDPLANYVIKTPVMTDNNGKIPLTKIWDHKLKPGNYDIVIDINRNAIYDERLSPVCIEPVDNHTGIGFAVIRPGPGSGTATGGTGSGGQGDHNYTYSEGDPYNEMLQLAVSVTGENMTGLNLTLSSYGTGNDKDGITKVDVVWDSNGDGIYQNGTEKLLGSGTYPSDNGNLTIAINSTNVPDQFLVTVGKTEYLLIVYEMAPGAQSGETFTFDVTSLWMRGVDSLADIQIMNGYTVKGFTKTVVAAEAAAKTCAEGNCTACANETACNDAGCGWCKGDGKCKSLTEVECQPPESSGNNKYCKTDCTWGTCDGTDASCYSLGGECRACLTGERCKNYACEAFCTGTTKLNIVTDGVCSAEISGLAAACDNNVAFLKEGTCSGKHVGTCVVSGGNCTVSFSRPAAGNRTYAACVDFNSDGDFTDAGESAAQTVQVSPGFDVLLIAIIIIAVLAVAGAAFWVLKMRKPKYRVPSAPSYAPPQLTQ
ncbi:MAG: hypothetical protein QXU82_03490 [Candidatus Aenigmatarchaeota archaeon]